MELKHCPQCGAIFSNNRLQCQICGYRFSDKSFDPSRMILHDPKPVPPPGSPPFHPNMVEDEKIFPNAPSFSPHSQKRLRRKQRRDPSFF